MAYVINRWNGTAVTTVEDGTVDQTLDIKLVGKNYAGYGEIQNETFVHMLENFASSSAPPNAISGQIWFDTASQKLKFYTGDQIAGVKVWKTAGGVEYGTEPTNPTTGDLWFDTSRDQLKVRTSSAWLTVGPQSAGTGTTQMVSRTVKGTDGNQHAIIAATIEDEVVYIISADEFTLDTGDADSNITGFNSGSAINIKKGLTLPYLDASGVATTGSFIYWGTAANSQRLGGYAAADFVRSGSSSFTASVSFSDLGYTVGDGQDLAVYIEGGTAPIIENQTGNTITFRLKSGVDTKDSVLVKDTGIVPGTTNTYNLGTASNVWATMYATTFSGTATQANTLNVGGTYRSASTSAGANTIAARDASGNITANVFSGIATSARYADLAEKYLTDVEYEPGTVVVVGGEAEVTASSWGQRAIGVVSTDPAFMMNKDLEGGTYIALKGRVPVKVSGSVKKGDRLIAGNNGTAVSAVHHANDIFAIALESNADTGVKTVECVIL